MQTTFKNNSLLGNDVIITTRWILKDFCYVENVTEYCLKNDLSVLSIGNVIKVRGKSSDYCKALGIRLLSFVKESCEFHAPKFMHIHRNIRDWVSDVIGLDNRVEVIVGSSDLPLACSPDADHCIISETAPEEEAKPERILSKSLSEHTFRHYHRVKGCADDILSQRAISSTFTPLQLASVYNFPSSDGIGQKIGIIELGGVYRDQDLQNYFTFLGIEDARISHG